MKSIDIDKLRVPDNSTAIPLLRFKEQLVNRLARVIDAADGTWPKSFNKDGGVVVDQDNVIIGGVHRYAAAKKRGLKRIPVTTHHFDSPAARLLFAIEHNAETGDPWSAKDESRLVILAEQFGIERVAIAEALRVPVKVIERKPVVSITRRSASDPLRRTYVPRPVRTKFKDIEEVSEEQAVLMESIVSPLSVKAHLADFLRIDGLDGLPPLDVDLYALVRETISRLQAWLDRDEHLLNDESDAA